MVDGLRRRGLGAVRWARRNPVPSAVAALVIAGASATAAVSGTPTAAYTGCGTGYAGTSNVYTAGYGTCPPPSNGGGGGGLATNPPTFLPVTTTSTTAPPSNPPQGTSSSSTPPGSKTATIDTKTSSTSISATNGPLTADVTIPAGALPIGTTVQVAPVPDAGTLAKTITSSAGADAYVAAFSVTWTTPSGTATSASSPITMTINDPSIQKGDVIYAVVNGTLQKVGVATANGSATVTFTSDPTFVVLAPPSLGLANPFAKLTGSTVGVRLICAQGDACTGTATLNVAHREGGKETQVFVAKGTFKLGQRQLSTVSFTTTSAGTSLFGKVAGGHHEVVSYVLHLATGARQVGRVVVR